VAFPVPEASVLTGASISQLHNWRRTALFLPEVESTNRPMLYSFRDIVALRSIVKLRQERSLQGIRRAFSNMPEFNLTSHPSNYSLVDTGSSIVVVQSSGEGIDVLAYPGQTVVANMAEIMAPFDGRRGKVVGLLRPRRHLEVRQERLGGWPTVENTRVPFDVVAELLVDGSVNPADVHVYYPGVSAEAARDALDFARSVPNWESARGLA
jgi:uncharacterized protein (DUF433 family)/DNA-binding transcriptional MerR regulator